VIVPPPSSPSAAAPEVQTGPTLMPADFKSTPETPKPESTQGKEPRKWTILRKQ